MIKGLLAVLCVLLVTGVAMTVYAALGNTSGVLKAVTQTWDAPASQDDAPRVFHIGRGQSASEIGRALESEGIIRSSLVFRMLVEMRGVDGKLESGAYELQSTMTTAQVLDRLLRGGASVGRRFTIPEGWRSEEVAYRLEELGLAPGLEFLSVVANPWRVAPYDQLIGNVDSLEGYLFPDTYELPPNAAPEAVVAMMVRQFDARATQVLRDKAKTLELTLQQAVVLASIIEREAVVEAERRLISGVFHNRLRAGMPLQADPTVQYAIAAPKGPAGPEVWKKDLSLADLGVPSPFNTYLVRGLPPAPICNPGLAALEAAVDPLSTPFFYFVATGEGTHLFATTEPEHVRNLERVGRMP